jgi:asparagine synthase (glutamine-hydrolysing)
MCGIAGVFNFSGKSINNLQEILQKMNDLQIHRGRDGEGYFVSEKNNLGFAHRRLSIVDLEGGKQPMTDIFENTIIFNGQIYNAPELRKQLEGSYPFKTQNSDTEVILAGFKKWGEKVLEKLEGMFAFVIFESKTGNVFFARDHIGIKPFYYTVQGENFFFASEAKALLPFLQTKEIEEDALKDYLAFQYYTGEKTLVKGVKILEAGYFGTLENKNFAIKQYFDISFENKIQITENEAAKTLDELLINSIKKHLVSDVPVTSYVSGGIDSSLIASMAAKTHNISEGYCGYFPGYESFCENQFAKAVTENAKISLNEVPIMEKDYIDNLENIHYFLDTPMTGYGLVNNFKMAKEVSSKYKVVLSGSGGDEIFGGYARYFIAMFVVCLKQAIKGDYSNLQSILPVLSVASNYTSLLNDLLKADIFALKEEEIFFKLISRMEFSGVKIQDFESKEYSSFDSFCRIFNKPKNASFFEKMCYFEQKTFLPALLLMEDKLSMASGLEARTPFVDKTIINFASSLPPEIKFANGNLKNILKSVAGGYLPEKVSNRVDKMGFSSPMNLWIKNSKMKDFVYDILTSQKAKERRYFDYASALKSFSSTGVFDRTLWGFLALELWQRNFIDKK